MASAPAIFLKNGSIRNVPLTGGALNQATHFLIQLIMQNSELYRRGFVVPLNKDAEQALINNNVDEETKVEFFEIPNEQVFESLWTKGLFKIINAELGLMIDDYEEEFVENFNINKLSEVINRFKDETNLDSEEAVVINVLEKLLGIADERKSSIFFIM